MANWESVLTVFRRKWQIDSAPFIQNIAESVGDGDEKRCTEQCECCQIMKRSHDQRHITEYSSTSKIKQSGWWIPSFRQKAAFFVEEYLWIGADH